MPIKGLTEKRRMPRIGKIHLGIKVKNAKGVEYPKATDYFVFPKEDAPGGELRDQLIKQYGEKPKELEVIFPLEDEESIASQYYRCYSRSRGLVCRGDGELATRVIDVKTGWLADKDTERTEMKEITCEGRDCPEYTGRAGCREVMNLQFMLPKISGLGVWQIDSGSINSIRNINSCIELIRQVYGRVNMVPLTLSIEPIEVTPEGGKKKTVHVLNLRSMDNMIEAAMKARMSPLELITGKPLDMEQVEKDIEDLWPQAEKDRMLTQDEAETRLTPEEIAEAEMESELPPEPRPEPAVKDETTITDEQVANLVKLMNETGMTYSDLNKFCNPEKGWGIRDFKKELKKWQYLEIVAAFEKGKP